MVDVIYKNDKTGDIKDEVLEKIINKNYPINGVKYNLRKSTSHDWDLPYSSSWYGISGSNTDKFATEQAVINVDDWLDIQASARNMSKSQFLKGASEDTKKRVEEDIKKQRYKRYTCPCT